MSREPFERRLQHTFKRAGGAIVPQRRRLSLRLSAAECHGRKPAVTGVLEPYRLLRRYDFDALVIFKSQF